MAAENQFDPHRDRQQHDPFFRPPSQYFDQLPQQISQKLAKGHRPGMQWLQPWMYKTGIAMAAAAFAFFWILSPETLDDQRPVTITREDALAYLLYADPDLEEMMEGYPAGADLLASALGDISFDELEILAGELYELSWDQFPENTSIQQP